MASIDGQRPQFQARGNIESNGAIDGAANLVETGEVGLPRPPASVGCLGNDGDDLGAGRSDPDRCTPADVIKSIHRPFDRGRCDRPSGGADDMADPATDPEPPVVVDGTEVTGGVPPARR